MRSLAGNGLGRVEIHLDGIRGNVAQIGIDAPKTVSITRAELLRQPAKGTPPVRR